MLVRTKSVFESKTMWLAVAVFALAVMEAALGLLATAGMETEWVLGLLAALIAILRKLTNQPVSLFSGDLKKIEE